MSSAMHPREILVQAASWIARLASDEVTQADFASFAAWQSLSAAHAEAGEYALQIWDLAGMMKLRAPSRRRKTTAIGAGYSLSDEEWGMPAAKPERGPHFQFAA